MSEPNLDPPAIIRPHYANRLTAIMAEAESMASRTVDQKIALGRQLLEGHEEWRRENELRRPSEKIPWSTILKRHHFSDRTARRLMKAALSSDRQPSPHSLEKSRSFKSDRIYDDGVTQEEIDTNKKPCRECRLRSKDFSKKCAGCRAFNREPPKPKEDKPLTDMDGTLVPEHLVPVFREGEIIRDLTAYLSTATQALGGLTERPGCAALPVDEMTKRLRSLKSFAMLHRPGQVHAECEGRGCDGCRDGWRTIKTVVEERAAASNAKAREKGKEWAAKKAASNQPIPE